MQTSMHYLMERLETKSAELLTDKYSTREVLTALLVERTLERYAQDLLGVDGDGRVDCVHFVIEIMSKFPDIQERMEQGRIVVCELFAKKLEAAVAQGELKHGLDSYALAAIIMATASGQLSLGRSFQSLEMRKRMLENVWLLLTL